MLLLATVVSLSSYIPWVFALLLLRNSYCQWVAFVLHFWQKQSVSSLRCKVLRISLFYTLRIFHSNVSWWSLTLSLNDSNPFQVSPTLLSFLIDIKNAVVCMFLISLIFIPFSLIKAFGNQSKYTNKQLISLLPCSISFSALWQGPNICLSFCFSTIIFIIADAAVANNSNVISHVKWTTDL